MVPFQIPVGLLTAALAAGLVDADARRRGLSRRVRRRWTAAVGLTSLAGFLAAFAFDGLLYGSYSALTGRPLVVIAPRELVAGLLLVGLAVSALAVLTYGLGSRRSG